MLKGLLAEQPWTLDCWHVVRCLLGRSTCSGLGEQNLLAVHHSQSSYCRSFICMQGCMSSCQTSTPLN